MPFSLCAGARPIPGYQLVDFLGRGTFGEVWKAEAPGGLHVALKFIDTKQGHTGPEHRALTAIREIRHPHLLDVHFVVQVDDWLVIATSLCDRSLWDRFRECREQHLPGIPLEELLRYLDEAAMGLDFLHDPQCGSGGEVRAGVQHRDVKPQNIFLVGGSVKLADFGLAKAVGPSGASHTGAMSPLFAAPEMFRGEVSIHSDQYSLALTYCQLRHGHVPFEGSFHEVMYGHLSLAPDLSSLPENEQPIVARALHKNPQDRWPNCREFARQLRAATMDSARDSATAAANRQTAGTMPAPRADAGTLLPDSNDPLAAAGTREPAIVSSRSDAIPRHRRRQSTRPGSRPNAKSWHRRRRRRHVVRWVTGVILVGTLLALLAVVPDNLIRNRLSGWLSRATDHSGTAVEAGPGPTSGTDSLAEQIETSDAQNSKQPSEKDAAVFDQRDKASVAVDVHDPGEVVRNQSTDIVTTAVEASSSVDEPSVVNEVSSVVPDTTEEDAQLLSAINEPDAVPDDASVSEPSDDRSSENAEIVPETDTAAAVAANEASPTTSDSASTAAAEAENTQSLVSESVPLPADVSELIQQPDLAALRRSAIDDLRHVLKSARTVKDSEKQSHALHDIAEAQASLGMYRDALETVRLVREEYKQAFILSQVILELPEDTAHDDVCAAIAEARGFAESIDDEQSRYSALSGIARAQAHVGMFPQALETARSIGSDEWTALALALVADARAEASDPDQASIAIVEATKLVGESRDEYRSSFALWSIAVAQAKLGMFPEALATARSMNNDSLSIKTLAVIAHLQTQSKLFGQAKATVRSIANDSAQSVGFRDIAVAEAAAGQYAEALETARLISDSEQAMCAGVEIAIEQAKNGSADGAQTVAHECLRQLNSRHYGHFQNCTTFPKVAVLQAEAGLTEDAFRTYKNAAAAAILNGDDCSCFALGQQGFAQAMIRNDRVEELCEFVDSLPPSYTRANLRMELLRLLSDRRPVDDVTR
ncbi:MAG: protein kinase [Planctomycetaceae bacterium]